MSEPTTAFTVVSPKEAPTREKPKEKQMRASASLLLQFATGWDLETLGLTAGNAVRSPS